MNDFEFFGTIGAFVSGFVLLIYLFRIRAKVINRIKLRLLQAKASIHYMTRPAHEHPGNWSNEATNKRPIR